MMVVQKAVTCLTWYQRSSGGECAPELNGPLTERFLQATNPLGAGSSDVASAQAAMMAVQKAMHQHGGSFLQFRCDEKGFLSICAFGLPSRTHEDDPCRGVRAALDLVEALRFLKGVMTSSRL